MNSQNITNQLAQSIEQLTETIANSEKSAIVETAKDLFTTKLEAKISQARNEAVTEARRNILDIAIAHQEATAQHLSQAIITNEKQSVVAEPLELDWGLEPIDMNKALTAAREAESNMRLLASDSEAQSWIEG